MFQLRETLFGKLDSFTIPYSDDQKLFKNIKIFNFESIYLLEDKFRYPDTTTWIAKHVPISVSVSSNLIEQPIFFFAIPIPELWLSHLLMLLMG